MLKPSANLKFGLPLLFVVFWVSAVALYGGAQLVKQDEASAADGGGDGGVPGGPTIVTLVAQNLLFSPTSITAGAGLEVTVTLDNRDAGVLHNVAFYTNRSASQVIAKGELITGPAIETMSFTAPGSAGTYFFKCDVHPDTMTGALVVR